MARSQKTLQLLIWLRNLVLSLIFQVQGEQPEIIAQALFKLTDRGKVPEALRSAHLVGSAVLKGESTSQA